MKYLLEMQNGSFSYNPQKKIYSQISFSVNPGEVLCLLGPNGCGKTTLLDNLLGYYPLDEGNILLDGLDAGRMSSAERARKVAYVPQIHQKTFPYTVEQVIMMGRTPHLPFHTGPVKSDQKKVDEIIELLNLEKLRHNDYTRLSGGETQLVLIARALVQESRVLVMDEPTNHLDYTNELIILETMKKLIIEKGMAIIMATHVPNHAFYFENHSIPVQVALMQQERGFSCFGDPETVLTPENLGKIYNVDTCILDYAGIGNDQRLRHIVPLRLRERV